MKNLILTLKDQWIKRPLPMIICLAAVIRLMAAFFSKGFAMHDDHFLVIEPAQAWLDGIIIPGKPVRAGAEVIPDGHSLFYMGAHYVLFRLLAWMHLLNPDLKMLIVRLIHAVLSLWSVWLSFKITKMISDQKDAARVGLLMAILWFLPMMGVRNLVEIACIPFSMAGILYIMLASTVKTGKENIFIFLAGIFLGICISIRFQMIIFAGAAGLVLLLQKKWKPAFIYGLSILIMFVSLQGIIDYLVWGKPFAEFIEYVRYNLRAAHDYLTGPWYFYLMLLSGILIPPVSLLLLFGFFVEWRKQLLLFLPAFLFLLFHSIFPNKQERFIFPILPYIIILGVTGWNIFQQKSRFWTRHHALNRNIWTFFWIVNIILLVPVSFASSKKARVDAMSYLSHYQGIKEIIAEDGNHESAQMLPRFYARQWMQVLYRGENGQFVHFDADSVDCNPAGAQFVLFSDSARLTDRVNQMKEFIPGLRYDTTIYPSVVDKIMWRLNPVNRNFTIYIYRNILAFPDTIKTSSHI